MKFKSLLISCFCITLLTGCMVDQSLNQDTKTTTTGTTVTNNEDEITEPRVIATSYATMQILDALDIDLIARVETSYDLPLQYEDVQIVGTAMAPDAEAIALLDATDIIGPDTLIEEIKPTYEILGLEGTFIDLQSVEGLYESVAIIGEKYNKQDLAQELIDDYNRTLDEYLSQVQDVQKPRVLVLMGLPGAYIGATPNSYVGSIVELAGATNVIQVDTNENFVSWNTEALIELDPDIILLTAHALPELSMNMFKTEFETNDIWKNFRAVEEGKVYSLTQESFGMSATFSWKEGFEELMEIFYEGTYDSFID